MVNQDPPTEETLRRLDTVLDQFWRGETWPLKHYNKEVRKNSATPCESCHGFCEYTIDYIKEKNPTWASLFRTHHHGRKTA